MDSAASLGSWRKSRGEPALEYLGAVDRVRPGGYDDLTPGPFVGRIRLHGVLAQWDRSTRRPH